jgi:hypothetical protein
MQFSHAVVIAGIMVGYVVSRKAAGEAYPRQSGSTLPLGEGKAKLARRLTSRMSCSVLDRPNLRDGALAGVLERHANDAQRNRRPTGTEQDHEKS